MATTTHSPKMQELIRRLDDACSVRDDEGRCRRVKDVLIDIVNSGEEFIDPQFLAPVPDRYARRLLHRDPNDRYTVLAMVWGPGQATPLHDHAGIWCVEGVVEGTLEVARYELLDTGADGVHHFAERGRTTAGVGSSGALIPPFEYHTLANASVRDVAITLHVYGGDMDRCSAFEPVEAAGPGAYLRHEKELSFHD